MQSALCRLCLFKVEELNESEKNLEHNVDVKKIIQQIFRSQVGLFFSI